MRAIKQAIYAGAFHRAWSWWGRYTAPAAPTPEGPQPEVNVEAGSAEVNVESGAGEVNAG